MAINRKLQNKINAAQKSLANSDDIHETYGFPCKTVSCHAHMKIIGDYVKLAAASAKATSITPQWNCSIAESFFSNHAGWANFLLQEEAVVNSLSDSSQSLYNISACYCNRMDAVGDRALLSVVQAPTTPPTFTVVSASSPENCLRYSEEADPFATEQYYAKSSCSECQPPNLDFYLVVTSGNSGPEVY